MVELKVNVFRDVRFAFVVGNGAYTSGVGDRKRTCGGERGVNNG